MQTFLYFLDKLPALVIEFLLGIFSIIGIILTYYGLSNIPFYINKKIYQNIFDSNIILFYVIISISLIFIFLRLFHYINHKLNRICYYLSMILIIICLLGFIINAINDSFIINNMYFYDNKANKNKLNKLTNKQWKETILALVFIIIIYFSFIFLALSDNLRINLKIDDSYYSYQLAIEEEIKNENSEQNIRKMYLENQKNNNINNNKEQEVNEKPDINKNNINNIGEEITSGNEFNKNLEQNEEKKE